jgi:hypothetical protein
MNEQNVNDFTQATTRMNFVGSQREERVLMEKECLKMLETISGTTQPCMYASYLLTSTILL